MGRWIEHCSIPRIQMSGQARSVWNCKPYYSIVRLGPNILPYVQRAYKDDVSAFKESPTLPEQRAFDVIQLFGLEAVITKLCGLSVPEDTHGTDYESIQRRKAYVEGWLDGYLNGAPSARSTQRKSR